MLLNEQSIMNPTFNTSHGAEMLDSDLQLITPLIFFSRFAFQIKRKKKSFSFLLSHTQTVQLLCTAQHTNRKKKSKQIKGEEH